ncbi:hypothetical protein [Mycoplasmopsis columboralis]|uniref:Uncharacterized protein n=1 Tax=Mycoplasmopsis columboralis TaxID=171282 RepID=A0A449B7G1_9BACT|nr:hypothetical protein [Mycoplasmopsis columboralis]VEU76525.1 Uncharacterised protein [Mycoplasmopsis columboralis]
MKINELPQVSEEDLNHINPGFSLVALATALPLIVEAIAPIIGLIKSSLAISGEIKDKNNSFKWDNSKKVEKTSTNTLNKYISF